LTDGIGQDISSKIPLRHPKGIFEVDILLYSATFCHYFDLQSREEYHVPKDP
jgi:hypothetical protein